MASLPPSLPVQPAPCSVAALTDRCQKGVHSLWENSPLQKSRARAPAWTGFPRAQPALASQFGVSLDVHFQGVGNLWPHHHEEMAKDKSTISTNPRIS